jgi:hypothetical protein
MPTRVERLSAFSDALSLPIRRFYPLYPPPGPLLRIALESFLIAGR